MYSLVVTIETIHSFLPRPVFKYFVVKLFIGVTPMTNILYYGMQNCNGVYGTVRHCEMSSVCDVEWGKMNLGQLSCMYISNLTSCGASNECQEG